MLMLLLPILFVFFSSTTSDNADFNYWVDDITYPPTQQPGIIEDYPESEDSDEGVIPKATETTAITTTSISSTSLQTGTTKKLPKLGTVGWGAIAGVPTTTAITTTPNTFLSSISPKPTYTKMIMFYGKITSRTTKIETISTDELSAKECIQECYASETCILTYMDTSQTCRFYDYTEGSTITIEETTDKDGEVVGFKVDLDDFDCPLTYKDYIGSIVTRTGNTGYVSLKIKKMGENRKWMDNENVIIFCNLKLYHAKN